MDVTIPGIKPHAFNVMLKPFGPICNLNCTYCYYLEKKNLYQETSNFKMKDEVLEVFIKEYIQSQDVPVISFVWQGGEPSLLGLDYYKKVVEIQNRYAGDKRIENSFQTNGTMLNDEFCKFFIDHNFLIGISVDGPEEYHNHHRLKNDNTGSFADVMRGIELLHKHKVEFNTLSVVNKHNSYHPLEVYNFLKSIGSGFQQYIPIVEGYSEKHQNFSLVAPSHDENARLTDWSVEPKQYGKFLCQIFDEWVRKDVGRTFVQIFDVTLANWMGERPGLCVFGETCGEAAAMEHNGDLYSCDHFVYPDYKLGNIMDDNLSEMMNSERQKKFGRDKRDKLPRYCFECEYRFACHGECPKNRFNKTPSGDPGLNYLCDAYKMFFAHVHPYMQFMADELKAKRPPANVMNWVSRLDRQKQQQIASRPAPKRNDPCPCGSGRKFKNCCINKGIYS